MVRWERSVAACALLVGALSACKETRTLPVADAEGRTTPSGQAVSSTGIPRVGHVFIVILENQDILGTYGPKSPAKYLVDTLAPMGAMVREYWAIGHASLANYTAAASGQAPDSSTSADCAINTEFVPRGRNGGLDTTTGQIAGEGCVYPSSVKTIFNQLAAAHLSFKAYMEDMGNDPSRESSVCGHVPVGVRDITDDEELEDVYAARHNPFVWFHAIIDGPLCDSVVSLAPLEQDLKSIATTPNYVWISPAVCHDGHDAPCNDGEPGGLVSANRWLREYMPLILHSPAYQQDGLLVIITDEGFASDACCGERPGPNEKLPGVSGPGGGRIGALAISRFIRPGTVSDIPYNHYSLLRTVFDIFQLGKFGQRYLGYAGQRGLVSFGSDIFTNPSGDTSDFARLTRQAKPSAAVVTQGD
jgi:phosphatidylinositol-3-phosphatase